ncbi:MAG: ATP-dependent DNA ligase [Lentisphaerae bacterium]|nr:ATP-dependent DNA ligase [Lentisphaerota bacterium]
MKAKDNDSAASAAVFVIHEHQARTHHFDFRLEKDGVLKSWAVPKGLPESPGTKRLAVQVEDHALEYGKFEGAIPEGEYGAGEVKIWDQGTYQAREWTDDRIAVNLQGKRIQGTYQLIRFRKAGENNWLIFKKPG